MNIQTNTTDRKALARRLAEELGEEMKYLNVPTFAYEVGPYRINRDGSIEGDDLEAIRGFLEREGCIAEPQMEEEPAATETKPGEEAPVEEAQPEEEPSEEEAPALDDGAGEIQESETEPLPIEGTRVSIPLRDFTAQGFENLLRMLYARQDLINAMTQGDSIYIDEELVGRMDDEKPDSMEAIGNLLKDEISAEMVKGVDFEDGKFTIAFPYREERPTEWKAYADLLIAAAERARQTKRVVSKRIQPEATEMKYFCHSWLVQLGFGGPNRKDDRAVLLGHLQGYAAFRTADKMDAHKAKLAEKRRIAREEAKEHEAD